MLPLKEIKKLIVIAVFSVNELFEYGVLKGGNALELIYDVSPRASIDIDISLPRDYGHLIDLLTVDLRKSIERILYENGLGVRRYQVKKPDKTTRPGLGGMGGGYGVSFTLFDNESNKEVKYDANTLAEVSENPDKPGRYFLIDFSVSEFCDAKENKEIIAGEVPYTIRVYTPAMLVIEKIRALCQSMPDKDFKTPLPARAKDFVDIYALCEKFYIDLSSEENIDLFKAVFKIKRIPLNLIGRINACRDFHRPDFDSVRDTVYPSFELKDFDFYFDYVLDKLPSLKSFGNE